MIHTFFRKYLSTIFLFATLMGSMHHHKDMQVHSDCKICVVHANIIHGNTSDTPFYLGDYQLYSEAIFTPLKSLHVNIYTTTFNSRAPPSLLSETTT